MNMSAVCHLDRQELPLGKAWKSFWAEVLAAPNPNYRRLLHKQKREIRRRVHRKIRRETRQELKRVS